MKIKTLVGISLVIFIILIVNIIAFGLLSKDNSSSSVTSNQATIINKTDESNVQNQINSTSSTSPTSTSSQSNSNTASSGSSSSVSSNQNQAQNQFQPQPTSTVQQPTPTPRVTRAS